MASVTTHGPTPNVRPTIRASPMIPPWIENIAAGDSNLNTSQLVVEFALDALDRRG